MRLCQIGAALSRNVGTATPRGTVRAARPPSVFQKGISGARSASAAGFGKLFANLPEMAQEMDFIARQSRAG
ncbi:MAG TPA: hypothetical protein VFI76_05425, partial [Terrimicrobiaceae bacterium]|nr:hypothetical protein [Terrimicrobiaceae bacterium]